MNIIHIVSGSNYIPETGIHIYVTNLCNSLNKIGFKNTVLVIKEKADDSKITNNSIDYISVSHSDYKEELLNISQKSKIEYFHFHSVFPYQLFNEMLVFSKDMARKTIITIHNNSLICYKGTMAFKNKEFCIQNNSNIRCLACLSDRHKFSVPIFLLNTANSLFHVVKQHKINYIKLLNQFRAEASQLLQNIDRIIILDQWVLDFLPKEIKQLKSIVHIQQAIKPNNFRQKEPRPKNNETRLVYIGRTDLTKGLLILVEALKNLESIKLDCYIEVTDQIYYEKALKIVNNNCLNVHFHPPIKHHKINEVLSSYDVLCLPSFSEMAPMLSLEALEFGIPILASDHPSFVSQSKLNSGIFLFKNGNIKSLNRELKKLIKHLPSKVSSNCNYEELIKKHIKLYNEL